MQINPNHFPFSFPSTERLSTHAPLVPTLNSSQSTFDCPPLPCTFSFHRNCHRDASKHTQNTLICNKQTTSHILSHANRVLATLRALPNPRNTARAKRVSIASPNKHRSMFNSTSNNRLHAHSFVRFTRTMRMTKAVLNMQVTCMRGEPRRTASPIRIAAAHPGGPGPRNQVHLQEVQQ